MFRNEKTSDLTPTSQKEMKQDEQVSYYSHKLKKLFTTMDELKTAEAEADNAEAEKAALSEARKVDAQKVEEAWKAVNTLRATCKTERQEADRKYLEAVTAAKKIRTTTEEEINERWNKVTAAYDAALAEFTKLHPEGYHLTLKDGDYTTSISRQIDSESDLFSAVVKALFNNIL